jgi:hypothetical protein
MQRSTKKYIPPVQVTTYYLLYEAFNTQLKYDLNKGETNEV